tara:strand:- start:744 stop:1577 length:834 start_codon:yes stop_codon:yes gene_type:complete
LTHLLSSIKQTKTFNIYRAVAIGVLTNQILPGRLGDFVSAYIVKKKEKIRLSGVLGAVAVERVIDVLFLTLLIVLTLLITKPAIIPPHVLKKIQFGGFSFGIASISAGIILYRLSFENSIISRFVAKIIDVFPGKTAVKLHSVIESFKNGLRALQNSNHIFYILGYSLAIWCTLVTYFSLIYPMFLIEASFEKSILTTLFMVLGIMIPSAPGAVGPYEAAMVLSLTLYDVEIENALGMAILIHFIDFLFSVSAGLFFLWKDEITLTEIQHSMKEESL